MDLHRFGYIPDQEDSRDFYYSVYGLTDLPELPRSVDLRTRDVPISDQEGLNTAVPCAISTAIQMDRLRLKMPPFTPSRLFLYHNARPSVDALTSDEGCSIRDALKSLVRHGVCDEDKWPYRPGLVNKKPVPYAYSGAVKPAVKSYERLPQDLALVKTALSEGHPVICGLMLYQGYDTTEVECSGNIPLPTKEQDPIGYYCLLLMGYDDGIDEFVVRNSRGPAWGWLGHGRIPYDYISTEATDLWILHCDK